MSASLREVAEEQHEPLKVFVHLAYGQDSVVWEKRWAAGHIVGLCEATPYGYGRAQDAGCDVTFSTRPKSTPFGTLIRLLLRVLLGFDYLHARHNADKAYASDIVWTHTESQFLALALIFAMRGNKQKRPKLLGQSVWLFDKWSKLDPLRKAFYRHLIKQVDCLTVHSPMNLKLAQTLFPEKRVQLVRFGIPSENITSPTNRTNSPHRIICLGNDRHRDWKTAIAAFRDIPGVELKIFSKKAPRSLIGGASNVEIRSIQNNEELIAELSSASLMVLPLKPNLHASGATALQEAVIFGLPVVATDVGGLDAYFDRDAVSFVPASSPDAMRQAALALLENPVHAREQALRAQAPIRSGELCAQTYINDHIDISRQLLAENI